MKDAVAIERERRLSKYALIKPYLHVEWFHIYCCGQTKSKTHLIGAWNQSQFLDAVLASPEFARVQLEHVESKLNRKRKSTKRNDKANEVQQQQIQQTVPLLQNSQGCEAGDQLQHTGISVNNSDQTSSGTSQGVPPLYTSDYTQWVRRNHRDARQQCLRGEQAQCDTNGRLTEEEKFNRYEQIRFTNAYFQRKYGINIPNPVYNGPYK